MIVGEFGAARAEAQADAEPDTIVFYGETFTLAREVGVMPLLEFAAAADAGVDAAEMAGLAAMHSLLEDCLTPGDWPRFRSTAKKSKADADVLLSVCMKVYEVISGRSPTESPTGSVGGPSSPSPSSSPLSTRKAALGLVPVGQADLLTG